MRLPSPKRLDTEQRPRPLHENVDEQRQQREHQEATDQHDLSREAADLLLPGHGPLLELQRALGHASVFGQVLALRVANLAQELLDLVAFLVRHTSQPPSTVTDWPVMVAESSDTRNRTALAMSRATVTRRNAISSTYSSQTRSGGRPRF